MIGKFLGKIVDYGIGKTQGGKPQVVVQFALEHEGQSRTFTWYGTLAPDNSGDRKGITITLKALAAMGMSQENVKRLSTDFFEGPKTGILDMTKDLSLDLQEEPDQTGKIQTRVQWVNDPNDTYVLKKLTAAENVQVMAGLDFSGDFYKIMQDKSGKTGGQSQSQNQGQNQGQGNNQGQGQNYNQGQNQGNGGGYNNGGQNQNQNYNQNQNQNYNNGGQNQNYNNGQNQNNGQQNNGQGGNGFKAPF